MKKLLLIGILVFISCIAWWYFSTPVDIRNEYLKQGITKEKIALGKSLLLKMEDSYGGRSNWEKYQEAVFVQEANWYGRLKISHWDTLPQQFRMRSSLGSHNCEMELLNGKNTGIAYKIEDDQFKVKRVEGAWESTEHNSMHEKMIFKNYWFQFPFRISEASLISYGGEEEVDGLTYDILYASWGDEKANKEFDQFLLYLEKDSHRIRYLYFTVREKMQAISLHAEFSDFKEVQELSLPHSQYVRYGKPSKDGVRFHENHYWNIRLE